VDRLSRYNKPITLHLHKNIIRKMADINEHLLRLTNLTSLILDKIDIENNSDEAEWLKLTALPNLQSVSRTLSMEVVPLELLFSLPHLTKFSHFPWHEVAHNEKLAQSIRGWTNLESCAISVTQLGVSSDLFQGYHTKLTSLSIYYSGNHFPEKWFQHLGNLKELNFTLKNHDGEHAISLKHLTSLETLSLEGLQPHELNSTRLKELIIFDLNEEVLEKELDWLQGIKRLSFDRPNDYRKKCSYKWLTALTALKKLIATFTQIDGLSYITSTLTDLNIAIDATPADLTHLTRFIELKSLIVTSEAIQDLSHISKLTLLESLSIDSVENNMVVPFSWSILSNLTRLCLSSCISPISHLPNLEMLMTTYTSPEFYLPNLTFLEIANSYQDSVLEADYTFVSRLTTLKSLQLSAWNYVYNCQHFSTLTALENLRFWEIQSEESYEHLSALSKLTGLAMAQAIKSAKILCLPTSLQGLRLGRTTEMPDDLVEKLKQRLPNLNEGFSLQ
jgi:hypothetical protein